MNIAMVSYWDFQAHGMQVIMRTPLYLAQHGHHVLFMVHSEQTCNPAQIEDLHPNITIRRFDLPLKFMRKLGKMNRARQLCLFTAYCLCCTRSFYRGGLRPDLIYAAEADAVLIGGLLRKLYRVPLVSRFYGISDITTSFGVDGAGLKHAGLSHFITRTALKVRADMVIVTDDGCHGPAGVRLFNPHVRDLKYWRNGIDRFDVAGEVAGNLRQSLRLGAGDCVLLTLSRLDPVKKVDRAIRCLHGLHEAGLRHVRLVVAGHGPDEPRLRTIADELGVTSVVMFVGAVHHTKVYEYYALADVFLSLNDQTNLGNPLWEALNAGKCIVTLNNGQTSSVIRDAENGILVDVSGNESDLVGRLTAAAKVLVVDPMLRARLSRGAKDFGLRHLWTWDERLKAELESLVALTGDQPESHNALG